MWPLPLVRSSMNVITLLQYNFMQDWEIGECLGTRLGHPSAVTPHLLLIIKSLSSISYSHDSYLHTYTHSAIMHYFVCLIDCKWDPPRNSGYPTHQTRWCWLWTNTISNGLILSSHQHPGLYTIGCNASLVGRLPKMWPLPLVRSSMNVITIVHC